MLGKITWATLHFVCGQGLYHLVQIASSGLRPRSSSDEAWRICRPDVHRESFRLSGKIIGSLDTLWGSHGVAVDLQIFQQSWSPRLSRSMSAGLDVGPLRPL